MLCFLNTEDMSWVVDVQWVSGNQEEQRPAALFSKNKKINSKRATRRRVVRIEIRKITPKVPVDIDIPQHLSVSYPQSLTVSCTSGKHRSWVVFRWLGQRLLDSTVISLVVVATTTSLRACPPRQDTHDKNYSF